MSENTNIPAEKAEREDRPDSCLHCVVMTAVEGWFQRHGQRQGNAVVIDVMHVISKLSECTVEFTQMVSDRSGRRRAMRFAHDALDGNVKAIETGKLQSAEVPAEH